MTDGGEADGRAPTSPQSIKRAARSKRPAGREVRVDCGRLEAAVAEQRLNGADVGAVFEQVCCEGVAQGVGRDTFGDAGFRSSGSNGSLNTRFVEVIAPHDAAARILREAGGGKDPLPAPIAAGARDLAFERMEEHMSGHEVSAEGEDSRGEAATAAVEAVRRGGEPLLDSGEPWPMPRPSVEPMR